MAVSALVTGGIGPGSTIPLLLTGGLYPGVTPAATELSGRRIRGRRILDVSELTAQNTVDDEIDQLLAKEAKPKAPEIDLLAALPKLAIEKRQKIGVTAREEESQKRRKRDTEIATLLFEFID